MTNYKIKLPLFV